MCDIPDSGCSNTNICLDIGICSLHNQLLHWSNVHPKDKNKTNISYDLGHKCYNDFGPLCVGFSQCIAYVIVDIPFGFGYWFCATACIPVGCLIKLPMDGIDFICEKCGCHSCTSRNRVAPERQIMK